jgi:hypothetical protein
MSISCGRFLYESIFYLRFIIDTDRFPPSAVKVMPGLLGMESFPRLNAGKA